MGLWEKLFGSEPKQEATQSKITQNADEFKLLTTYKPEYRRQYSSLYESELIRAAIDVRARHFSKLKVEFRGSAQPTLVARLRKQPNDWQTWSQFLYRVSTILDVNNNCFIVPTINKNNEVTGYFPVLPEKCELIEYPKGSGNLWLRYKFRYGGSGAIEFNRCALLTKFQYESDLFGSSNTSLNNTMNLIELQNEGISEAVKNSATYRFMAKVNNFTKPEDLAKERTRFTEENLRDDAGGILLFPNTYTDIKQITNQPYTVDKDQMDMIKTNVYNYYGVNDKVLQGNAMGDELDAFYNSFIEPLAIQFSEVMSKAIFTERERVLGNECFANSNRLQYMTIANKVAMVQQMGDRGMLTINEARELFNYPPVPDGDKSWIRGEYKLTMEDNADEDTGSEN